jgi:predicted SnoaL-like aldol condensation-catalyzing enzyme
MKNSSLTIALFIAIILSFINRGFAQIQPAKQITQQSLLQSKDAKLAANKKLVYNFWREVLEAGHMELAPKYMTETYIQHNPNVPSGRKGFIDFFSKFRKPQPIVDSIKAPLISIVAEGDLVVLSFVRELPDPKDPAKKYSTTSFDMLRVENGKVAEHWDAAVRQ